MTDRYFSLTLPNLIPVIEDSKKDNVAENVAENAPDVAENVAEKSLEEQILDLIRSNPGISRKEMASAIGKTEKTVERSIKSSSKIRRVGSFKGGHWEIVD